MLQESPENRLENDLRLYGENASHQTEFYKSLLSADVILLIGSIKMNSGFQVFHQGQQIKIRSYEDGIIPFFTFVNRIFENGVIKGDVKTLVLNGKDLFNLTQGASYILNPYSHYSKELTSEEVKEIASGNYPLSELKSIVHENNTVIQIGQPAIYPVELINELKKIFIKKTNVRAAYVGWIFNPSGTEPPHFIFGLAINGDPSNVFNEASLKTNQFMKPNEIVDFVKIEDEDFISSYFLTQTKPFYQIK